MKNFLINQVISRNGTTIFIYLFPNLKVSSLSPVKRCVCVCMYMWCVCVCVCGVIRVSVWCLVCDCVVYVCVCMCVV